MTVILESPAVALLQDEKSKLQGEGRQIETTMMGNLAKENRMEHKNRLLNISWRIQEINGDLESRMITLQCSSCQNKERIRIADFDRLFVGKPFSCMSCFLQQVESK